MYFIFPFEHRPLLLRREPFDHRPAQMPVGGGSGLWAHPPLPPGKRVSDRSSPAEDRRSTFAFIRRFPSVRRNGRKKDEENVTDTTYESFDSLFDDNDIVLVGTEYYDNGGDKCNDNKRSAPPPSPPFTSMFRSRSDGNLADSGRRRRGRSSSCGRSSVLSPHREPKGASLTKYLKALSGSWKNLLNSKFNEKTPPLRETRCAQTARRYTR